MWVLHILKSLLGVAVTFGSISVFLFRAGKFILEVAVGQVVVVFGVRVGVGGESPVDVSCLSFRKPI